MFYIFLMKNLSLELLLSIRRTIVHTKTKNYDISTSGLLFGKSCSKLSGELVGKPEAVETKLLLSSVDSINRTVHLAFHGLFSLLKILFSNSKQYF